MSMKFIRPLDKGALLKINNLIFQPKYMLRELERTQNIYVKTDGLKNIFIIHSKNDVHLDLCYIYCKSGNFRQNFISTNSVKRQICDIEIRD